MSDLQDLIARNAVMAYNEGFERGAAEERERIIKLLEEQIVKNVVYQHTQRMWNGGYASGQNEWNGGQDADQAYIQSMAGYLISLIKGEQK